MKKILLYMCEYIYLYMNFIGFMKGLYRVSWLESPEAANLAEMLRTRTNYNG